MCKGSGSEAALNALVSLRERNFHRVTDVSYKKTTLKLCQTAEEWGNPQGTGDLSLSVISKPQNFLVFRQISNDSIIFNHFEKNCKK